MEISSLGYLRLKSDVKLDASYKSSLDFTLKATGTSGASKTETYSISVNEVTSTADSITLTASTSATGFAAGVNENAAGATVGTLSRSDGTTKTYSLITSFHLIEHIDNKTIMKIIYECRRILKDNGLLILETPSIDNLIISSRQFYLDPTHINPINPDGIKFLLDQCGFAKAKYYFINGGPLQNSNEFSLTRVFNGVAQDLLIFALPTKDEAERFFDSSDEWIKDLDRDRLFSFPLNADGKAQNAASKKSMYYIRSVTSDKDLVAHSFRHTFKDLVRNAEISKELHDFITGHSGGDSSSYYGEGHSLERRKEALDKVSDFHRLDKFI